MEGSSDHHRTIKHFEEPGHVRELTFSCFQRRPLLTNDRWRRELARSIDQATERYAMRLIAFVFMPEHVHLMVLPPNSSVTIPQVLSAIKQPVSFRIKVLLKQSQNPLLKTLTVFERRKSRSTFRFWEKGPGYDRNLITAKSIESAIDYIRLNPVKRGLVMRAADWHWSSALHYVSDGQRSHPDLPRIHGLPDGYLSGLGG